MALGTPPFWWRGPDWRAAALTPLSVLYGTIAAHRLRHAPREKVALPVLCVGNFTVGGSGKTPVVAALARAASAMGLRPGILSRGHGGSIAGPHRVGPDDEAAGVGDEPLLLAEAAPVAVARDRAAGAKLLQAQGCDVLLMDDGFQSARLHMDHALLVVDARNGLGNGRVLPAGPLRAPLAEQLACADALLVMGEGNAAREITAMAENAGKRVFRARAAPLGRLDARRFLAFAGIGHPSKFFATVAEAGGSVMESRAFPDHHVYSDRELADLAASAARNGLDLVTTTKDAARIGRARLAALLPGRAHVLEIEAVFEDKAAPRAILEVTLDAARERLSLS